MQKLLQILKSIDEKILSPIRKTADTLDRKVRNRLFEWAPRDKRVTKNIEKYGISSTPDEYFRLSGR